MPAEVETQVYHDTLDKVAGALRKLGFDDQQVIDIVNEILNVGVLFRERVRDDAR